MATEVGDTIEFVVDNKLLQKLMYDDDSLAVEDDEDRKIGVAVEEIIPESKGKLRVRAKVSWIEEPEV
jgi:hypothetical protein